MRRKSPTERAADARKARSNRRRNIKRGMKIALYEVNQILVRSGVQIAYPPQYIPYTVAIAEGNRRGASEHDIVSAEFWTWMAGRMGGAEAKLRRA